MVRFLRLVAIVTLWHIAASLCYYAVYAGTPLFRDVFSLSAFSVGIVITALTLGYLVFLLPIGVATDQFGEHRLLTLGLCGLATGALLIAFAPTFVLLLVAAFFTGSMYGTATPGTNKAIFDNVESAREYRAIGIKQIGPTIGSAVSAVLVTGLAGVFFWQAGFLVVAIAAFGTAGLFYLTYPVSETSVAAYPDVQTIFKNRLYLLLAGAGVGIGAAFYTTTGYTVLFVTDAVGASILIGGVVLAVLQVFGSLGKLLAGYLADLLDGRATVVTGSLLASQAFVGGVFFFVLPVTNTPLTAGIAASVLGLTVVGSTGLYYSCISTVVLEEDLGGASAIGQFAVTGGGLLAPPAFGYLVDMVGYAAAWSLLGVFSLVAAGLVVLVVVAAR